MKKLYVGAMFLLGTAILPAQGKGHGAAAGRPVTTFGGLHSNAPVGTPAASADRDFGRSRAEDVGKGKQKGLQKNNTHKRSKAASSQVANKKN